VQEGVTTLWILLFSFNISWFVTASFLDVQRAFVSLVLERGGCDASSSGGRAAHASSGASSSGGPHRADDMLPALDAGIWQGNGNTTVCI